MNNQDYAKKEWLENIEASEESTWSDIAWAILAGLLVGTIMYVSF